VSEPPRISPSWKATMSKDLFSHKMKNFTGQLDDTSLINKTRKDIARIELLLSERASKGAKS